MKYVQQSYILPIAKAIHDACVNSAGSSAGSCKEATLALALALEPIDVPVAVCQGKVVIDGSEYDHYWCRIDDTIIDPTADQFGMQCSPLIELETSLPHYLEASFFVFTPKAVLRLLQAAQPDNLFKPITD